MSLLTCLRRQLQLSSTLVKTLKSTGEITVNGVFRHTNFQLQPGDVVAASLTEECPDFPAQPMDLHILYEDDAIIALDKPAGLILHPTPSRQTGTLANGLLHYYKETGQACGIHAVSRLDRDTFGVVVFAKHGHIHQLLQGTIQKTYLAQVAPCPLAERGTISLPIGRTEGLFRKIDKNGQPAITQFQVVDRLHGILVLIPVTGRTHQLRLHCKSAGFPIVNDPFYTFGPKNPKNHQKLLAWKVEFSHPLTEQSMEIASQFPL